MQQPRRRFLRVLARAAACVLFGVVATWVLGCVIALWEQRPAGVHTSPVQPGAWASIDRPSDRAGTLATLVAMAAGAPASHEVRSKAGVELSVLESGFFSTSEHRIWRFGWPLPCVGWTETAVPFLPASSPPPVQAAGMGGWTVEPWAGCRIVLPRRVRWSAAAINAALWGGALGAIVFGVPALRRWRRSRRDACASCGYARAGLAPGAPCPECGSSFSATT